MSSILIRRANMVAAGSNPGRLPAGYTELAYIESTGSQWLDIGIKSIINLKTEIVFQQTQLLSRFPTIVGGMETSSYYKVILGYNYSSNIFYSQCGNGSGYINLNTLDTAKHSVAVENETSSQSIQIDGQSYSSSYNITSQQTKSIVLFARRLANNTVSNFVAMKLWSAKFYSSGNMVMDLVPAMRDSDSVVGMYDLVRNTFLTNVGSGTFNYGTL